MGCLWYPGAAISNSPATCIHGYSCHHSCVLPRSGMIASSIAYPWMTVSGEGRALTAREQSFEKDVGAAAIPR